MHIKKMGQGPDLVMLHGWSMHSAVWHNLAEELAKHFTLHLVDLPGHGQSNWQHGALDLDVLIGRLGEELPESAYWLGWSLGGLISIVFADRFPERVTKLTLIAATPCFVKTANWSCAMEASVFNDFAANLSVNQAETLHRFLLLQARGSQHSRDTIRQLAHQLAVEQPPVLDALQAGLKLLIELDMREPLSTLSCPVQMILGDRDTLIPEAMLLAAKQLHPKLQTRVLAGAGHAPFISQPLECQQAIEQFINE
ncbi:MAG: pimeloyl-ACP methyl ester esterase BioH [Gammaproteobacteria bacterium]|nr:pimeloyl-ACP methyl ester esterase BioH [Gammaproteobacteria bacterium]